MVFEEDCPCTDTTEASNVTSLQSDLNSESKETHLESSNQDDSLEAYKIKDCKCYDVHPSINYGTPTLTEAYTIPTKREQPTQKEPSKDQSPAKQFQITDPCLCRTHKISAYTLPVRHTKDAQYSRPFWCRFKWKWPRREYLEKKGKTYEVKLKQNQCPHYEQPFVCCELSEGIPRKNRHDLPNTKPPKYQAKPKGKVTEMTEKIDIYYFDHGNSAYYRTTDSPPILMTEKCAEKTDQAATRFWAEIFGTIHIGTAFVTAFILQLLRFLLFSIIRPLTVGILQLYADYFIKPFLSIVFNALIQPVLILLYNIATSVKDLCEPLAEAFGLFLREIANLCAAIRVVEVKHANAPPAACT